MKSRITARTRVLFGVWADADNVNAQSLNARDIAVRLDPTRFVSTFFISREPDVRLLNHPAVELVKLPPRLGSLVMGQHLIWGRYDLLFYPPFDRLMTWYRAAKNWGTPKKIVATVEGTAAQIKALAPARLAAYLRVLREAAARYSLSPYIAETVLREFNLRTGVIPIGVDTRLFKFRERRGQRPPVKILCVASIQPRKQLHVILDLARVIAREQAEFHIIGEVIGSPDYRDSLVRRKEEERLDHVSFHGRLGRSAVNDWMAESDVFILPSRLEGTPKVLMEAAATGLPCVVFDDYQTPSVVDGVTGFQVKTLPEMLERLRLLIADPDLRRRMGEAGAEHAKQFDWDVVVKDWEKAFRELTDARA